MTHVLSVRGEVVGGGVDRPPLRPEKSSINLGLT